MEENVIDPAKESQTKIETFHKIMSNTTDCGTHYAKIVNTEDILRSVFSSSSNPELLVYSYEELPDNLDGLDSWDLYSISKERLIIEEITAKGEVMLSNGTKLYGVCVEDATKTGLYIQKRSYDCEFNWDDSGEGVDVHPIFHDLLENSYKCVCVLFNTETGNIASFNKNEVSSIELSILTHNGYPCVAVDVTCKNGITVGTTTSPLVKLKVPQRLLDERDFYLYELVPFFWSKFY